MEGSKINASDRIKQRKDSCPFRDEIDDVSQLKDTINKMAMQIDDMFGRLFVQNGHNNGKDCLSVQIQKNTEYRENLQDDAKTERRNKWARRGFYFTLVAFVITNIIVIIERLV